MGGGGIGRPREPAGCLELCAGGEGGGGEGGGGEGGGGGGGGGEGSGEGGGGGGTGGGEGGGGRDVPDPVVRSSARASLNVTAASRAAARTERLGLAMCLSGWTASIASRYAARMRWRSPCT